MLKLYKINITLTEEEYEELLERLECEEYNYVGKTDLEQKKYEEKMRRMRYEMIHRIKKNLIKIN